MREYSSSSSLLSFYRVVSGLGSICCDETGEIALSRWAAFAG